MKFFSRKKQNKTGRINCQQICATWHIKGSSSDRMEIPEGNYSLGINKEKQK